MKNLYLLTLALVCFFVPGKAQDSCSADLKLYWNLNQESDSLLDVINNNAIVADSTIQHISGILDSALYFDGATKASISADSLFDWESNSSFAFEFWMLKASACSTPATSNNNVIIGRDDPGTQLHWWVGVSCLDPGKIAFVQYSATGEKLELVSKKVVTDSLWHHIVVVRDGINSETSLFIDGARDTTVSFTYTGDFKSDVPVTLGWINLNSEFHYNGSLDELAFYDTVLVDSIVTEHYNQGSGKSYCEKEDQTPTPVTDGKPDESGSVFSVYPTVVTSELNVDLRINQPQSVIITAFDMSGRKIADLYNSWLSEGDHTLKFTSLHQQLKLPGHSFVVIQLKLKDKTLTQKVILAE